MAFAQRNIDVVFIAERKKYRFLSLTKDVLFTSVDPRTTIIVAKEKALKFISQNYKSVFISDEKPGKRCNG